MNVKELHQILNCESRQIRLLDIGAMDLESTEKKSDLGYFSDLQYVHVSGFEPLEAEYEKLVNKYPDRSYLPFAVGDGTERSFFITNTGFTSSLYEPDLELMSKFNNLAEFCQVKDQKRIKTVRLDDVANLGRVDFLKIDVQGAELDILKNARKTLQNVSIVQTEVEMVPLYKHQPLFSDIDQELRQQGFQFFRFLGAQGRTFQPISVSSQPYLTLGQQLWSDAVYVRDFMKVEDCDEQQLYSAALVLHQLYYGFDLCHYFLKELDQRDESNFAEIYLDALLHNRHKN